MIYYGNLPKDSRGQVSGIESNARAQKMKLEEAVGILNGRKGIATLPSDSVENYTPPSGVKCKEGVLYLIPERTL